jgi:hypothetical protein
MHGQVGREVNEDLHQCCLLLVEINKDIQFGDHFDREGTKMLVDHFLSKFSRK